MFDRHVISKLDSFLDGRLNSRQRSRVETHLRQCESCRREWETQFALWQKLSAAPDIAASNAFTERVLRAANALPTEIGAETHAEPRRTFAPVREEDADGRRGWASAFRWAIAPTTLAVVAISAGLVIYFLKQPPPPSPANPSDTAPKNAAPNTVQHNATGKPVALFEEQIRRHLRPDDAQKIIDELMALPYEKREDFMLKVWEQHGLNKEELQPKKD